MVTLNCASTPIHIQINGNRVIKEQENYEHKPKVNKFIEDYIRKFIKE